MRDQQRGVSRSCAQHGLAVCRIWSRRIDAEEMEPLLPDGRDFLRYGLRYRPPGAVQVLLHDRYQMQPLGPHRGHIRQDGRHGSLCGRRGHGDHRPQIHARSRRRDARLNFLQRQCHRSLGASFLPPFAPQVGRRPISDTRGNEPLPQHPHLVKHGCTLRVEMDLGALRALETGQRETEAKPMLALKYRCPIRVVKKKKSTFAKWFRLFPYITMAAAENSSAGGTRESAAEE